MFPLSSPSLGTYTSPCFGPGREGSSHRYIRWEGAAAIDDYWYNNHPVIKDTSAEFRIPIGLHGDDAGVHGLHQVFVLTWGGVASKLSTLDSRIIFSMVRVADMTDDTMTTVLAVLRWSIECLSLGYFPYKDHRGKAFDESYEPQRAKRAGEAIAGEFVGCWSELRGDWKFLKEVLVLKEHYNNPDALYHLCSACRTTPGLEFTNFAVAAAHR